MRISDWSSDVCSSDLEKIGGIACLRRGLEIVAEHRAHRGALSGLVRGDGDPAAVGAFIDAVPGRKARLVAGEMIGVGKLAVGADQPLALGEGDRKSVGWGKGVSVRVIHGGWRN